jgi:hypothetical protein
MWRWIEYFFAAIAGIILLVISTAGVGVAYHNYKVKKRGVCHFPDYK